MKSEPLQMKKTTMKSFRSNERNTRKKHENFEKILQIVRLFSTNGKKEGTIYLLAELIKNIEK